MAKIQRALISVSDKTGLVPFAQILAQAGIEIISTGGTAKTLREAGLAVKDISEHTGFPEMLDGRVKTLHPKVHGGLLFIRGNETHEAAAQQHGISPIDLVVVNLYPFEATVAKPNVSLHDAIENIDIGGPSMLRSAAKNHDSVTVVVDPMDYSEVAQQTSAGGHTTVELRRALAAKVFARTAAYDGAIAADLEKEFKVGQASSLSGAGWKPALLLSLAASRSVVAKSTLKVFKLRLFTPMSAGEISSARSNSSSSWTSTSTASPASTASEWNFCNCSSVKMATMSRMASAPHSMASRIWRSSMMKSFRSRGIFTAARIWRR